MDVNHCGLDGDADAPPVAACPLRCMHTLQITVGRSMTGSTREDGRRAHRNTVSTLIRLSFSSKAASQTFPHLVVPVFRRESRSTRYLLLSFSLVCL